MQGRQPKLSTQMVDKAVALYASGKSSYAIAEMFSVDGATVLTAMRKRGVRIRDISECQRRHALDHSAFSTITPSSAYWMGFLMADGSICKNSVSLALCNDDRSHIEAFRSFLGSTHKIMTREPSGYGHKPYAYYTFRSSQIVTDLSKHGIVRNKTMSATASDVLAMNADFWRGVVDGDGSLHFPNLRYGIGPAISLVGSRSLLEQFAIYIIGQHIGWRGHVRAHKRIHTLSVGGYSAIRLIRALYGGVPRSVLDRKYERAMAILDAAASCITERQMTFRFETPKNVKKPGMSVEAIVLNVLHQAGRPLSTEELAEEMGVSPSQATKRRQACETSGVVRTWRDGRYLMIEAA